MREIECGWEMRLTEMREITWGKRDERDAIKLAKK